MAESYQFEKVDNFDPLQIDKTTHFTQWDVYGDWQTSAGNTVERHIIKHHDKVVGYFQLVAYNLFSKNQYLYIPHGPVLAIKPDEAFFKSFQKYLLQICKETNAVFARFDLYPPTDESASKLANKHFHPISKQSYFGTNIQEKYDWVLDIDKDPEELKSQMHPKTRYNLKLSQRNELTIKKFSGEELTKNFDNFWELMLVTAARGNYNLRPCKYFENIFESSAKRDEVALYSAYYNDKPIVFHFIIFYGEVAYYPYGCSSNEYRNLHAPYRLHFEAMLDARERGLKQYNFGGVNGAKVQHKGWEGISDFKQKWGGRCLEFGDYLDLINKPTLYYLYDLRKKIKNK